MHRWLSFTDTAPPSSSKNQSQTPPQRLQDSFTSIRNNDRVMDSPMVALMPFLLVCGQRSMLVDERRNQLQSWVGLLLDGILNAAAFLLLGLDLIHDLLLGSLQCLELFAPSR